MEEQEKFLEIVDELRGIARSQENRLSKEEIRRYLDGMGLSEQQFMAVYQYLGANRVEVEGYRYVPPVQEGVNGDGLQQGKEINGDGSQQEETAGYGLQQWEIDGDSSRQGGLTGDGLQQWMAKKASAGAMAKKASAGAMAKKASTGASAKKPSARKERGTGTQAERNRMLYRRELAALKNNGEAEENQKIQAYLEGDTSLRNEIVEAQLKNVVGQVVKYRKRNVPEEDIIAEGNLALLNEISLLEKGREQFRKGDGSMDVAAFKEALWDGVIRAMEEFVDGMILSKDREETVLARVNLLYEATKYLAEEYGRMPTEEELAEYTRMEPLEIKEIRGLSKDL